MNRKQKVAVVVGVVVVVLLVLFPLHTLSIEEPDREGLTCRGKPQTVLVRWIGWPPPSPPQYVTYEGKAPVDPRASPFYDMAPDKEEYLKVAAHLPKVHENLYVKVRMNYEISLLALAISISATLALTVAAVVVLKERKAAS